MNVGDGVLISNSNNDKIKDSIGIIINKKDDGYTVARHSNTSWYMSFRTAEQLEDICNVEKVRQDIIDYYTPQIDELKSKLKKVTADEKLQERVQKYNDIKYRIIKNCERVAVCEDDDEFENRLKEINKLKKELHSIDLDCGDEIRKQNGKIKYDIRQIEADMNRCLGNISDTEIDKVFSRI